MLWYFLNHFFLWIKSWSATERILQFCSGAGSPAGARILNAKSRFNSMAPIWGFSWSPVHLLPTLLCKIEVTMPQGDGQLFLVRVSCRVVLSSERGYSKNKPFVGSLSTEQQLLFQARWNPFLSFISLDLWWLILQGSLLPPPLYLGFLISSLGYWTLPIK